MNDLINREAMTELIKVNFPLTEDEYKRGNGEGMWVRVDQATKKAYDEDASGGEYFGILANDSLYYPGLRYENVVVFEMRGENRPVADFHGFLSKLAGISPEEKDELIRKIQSAHTTKTIERQKAMSLAEAVLWLKRYQGYEPMVYPDGKGIPAIMKHAVDLTDEVVDTILAALPVEVGGTKKE